MYRHQGDSGFKPAGFPCHESAALTLARVGAWEQNFLKANRYYILNQIACREDVVGRHTPQQLVLID